MKRSEIELNGEKNRIAAIGLGVFVVGALVGLLAGNKDVREQLNLKSKQLLSDLSGN